MPKNAYQRLAAAQTGLGKKLSDITHEESMAKLDIADMVTQLTTLESSTEGMAQFTNMIKSQRRLDEQDTKETAEAEKLGFEKVVTKKGGWFGETGFLPETGYKDPESGDVFTGEYLTEQAEINKELAQQGVDFDKYKGMLDEAKGDTAEIKSQFKSFQKVQERVGKDYGDLLNVVNDFGNQYRIAGENGEYEMLDFSAIESNLDELVSQMTPREEVAVAPNIPDMDETHTYEVNPAGTVPTYAPPGKEDVPTYEVDIMDMLKTSIEDYQKAGMEEYGAYYKSFGLGSPLQYWNQRPTAIQKGKKK